LPARTQESLGDRYQLEESPANFLPISEKYLLKAEVIALESIITLLPTTILEKELNLFVFRVINSLMPAQVFLIFLLFAIQ